MALRVLSMRVVSVGLIVGIASLFGGCVSEQDYKALKAENEDLRGRNATLEGQTQQLTAQNESLKQQQVTTGPAVQGGGDYPPGTNIRAPKRGAKGDSGQVVIEVAGDVLFASGQATLKADAKKELDGIAKTIKTKYSGHSIRVEGYTDSDVPKKSHFKSNEALSEARANAVREYLSQKGVSNISAVGMGASNPKASKKDSRRVEIVVVGT